MSILRAILATRGRTAAAAVAAVVAAMLVAGCAGGDLAGLTTASAGATTSDDGATARFDPFGRNEPDTTRSLRQVIKNPTLAEVLQPGPLPEMSLGRADAPVTVVEYASLTCPYCRHFHKTTFPAFKRAYIDTGKVRFVLREFPIGFQSGAATIALRCAPPERYFDLYGRFMDGQASWVSQEVRRDPIYRIAATAGLSRKDFDACYQSQALIDGLKQVKDRGRTLGVIGTPNFFVNERLIKSVPTFDELKAMIDPLLARPVASRG